jgi:DNA-binding LacI/PurR family transcriptional regulator
MFIAAEHYARAIQAMRRAGLSVPGDVSIVGVQNSPAELDRIPA